jgi:hypothetical protein
MTQSSAPATEAARGLWARTARDTSAPQEVAAAADRMCTQLRTGLGRWIGDEGYRALLDRALGLARAEHPALGGLSCLGGDEPLTATVVRAHGVVQVAGAMMALVAVLIELLGRIIGDEMAVHLVEQIGVPSPRGVVSTESQRGRDG